MLTVGPATTAHATDRRRVVLGWTIALVGISCSAVALGLSVQGGGAGISLEMIASDLVLATTWPLAGALVVQAQPRNAVGWVMLGTAFIGPYHVAAAIAARTGGDGAAGSVSAWVAIWGFAAYFFTVPVLPYLFPDGRPLSRRWALVLRAVVVVATLATLARMFGPGPDADLAPGVGNPLAIESAPWLRYVTAGGAGSLFLVGLPLGLVSLGIRLRRAQDRERTQLYWLLLGGLVLVVGAALAFSPVAENWGFAIGLAGPPVAIAIAMLRHQLFDVELTLSRTVAFGLITAVGVTVYVVLVYGVEAVAPGSRWGVLLVAIAALAAAAARNLVQDVVDRRLFGHRHNAYAVVTDVGRRVAAASQPVDALQRLVEGLRESLRLPYVAYVSDELTLASGTPVHGSRVVAAHALGAEVGQLHVGLRSPHERWTEQEESAVAEVASRAGTLAYAAELVGDVARSRGRIVAAREEERRRLRADLHDGVAPALAGTALQLDSLARRIRPLDEQLADRAEQLRDGLRAGVVELRAVVHGLRPPVLDQLGLADAVRQLVSGHEQPRASVHVAELSPPHAAVEVAAYAIVSEAFGNALRHSVASQVDVSLDDVGDDLVVTVRDNGVGMPHRVRAGVGMRSMQERAAEVGGRVVVTPTPGGGTTVTAYLPREVA
jgi:signal transduction histidine kinase